MLYMGKIYIMGFKNKLYKLIKVKNLNMEKCKKLVNFYWKQKLILKKDKRKLKNKKMLYRNKKVKVPTP